MVAPYAVARLPRVEFGAGRVQCLPELVRAHGARALLVTGARSLADGPHGVWLEGALAGLIAGRLAVAGEPSPELVDDAVRRFRHEAVDVVLGVGGGSVLDAAKAVAGLLRPGNPVADHLEGVGPELPYRGPATPFIAVPTTAGTGSEATKNAVLSLPGRFKKSFRDEALVARVAVVDPDLLATCPPPLIAANGMDALTQLLESYVSSRASPFTDALAWSGLEAARRGLLAWHRDPAGGAQARAAMAYASLTSGITLAQAGLGSVHGLAAPLGALFPIPHGVACGTLLAEATRVNLAALEARAPDSPALAKYARVGRLLADAPGLDDAAARRRLVDTLAAWTRELALPSLAEYGIRPADLARVVADCRGSSMKTNPVVLSDAEVTEILQARL